MEEQKINAFLYPLQSILVVRTNDARGQAARNGQMASLTGLPAITLPGGFSKPSDMAPLGVPVGIELMGKPFSEETLIGMGFCLRAGNPAQTSSQVCSRSGLQFSEMIAGSGEQIMVSRL